jgi:hypothetical protein
MVKGKVFFLVKVRIKREKGGGFGLPAISRRRPTPKRKMRPKKSMFE